MYTHESTCICGFWACESIVISVFIVSEVDQLPLSKAHTNPETTDGCVDKLGGWETRGEKERERAGVRWSLIHVTLRPYNTYDPTTDSCAKFSTRIWLWLTKSFWFFFKLKAKIKISRNQVPRKKIALHLDVKIIAWSGPQTSEHYSVIYFGLDWCLLLPYILSRS